MEEATAYDVSSHKFERKLDSGDEESKVDIEEIDIDKSEVKWDCKSGLQVNAVQYPLMNKFGINFDNI